MDAGSIEIDGQSPPLPKFVKENIGIVLDASLLPDYVSIKDINLIMKNIYKQWDSQLFFNYIDKMQLPEKKLLKEYSKGMKTKLSIAVALSHKATLLILDEATSGLDPIIRDEILDIFLDFIQNDDCSVLISSHITSDLEKIADYITFIQEGEIVLSEPKDELLFQYGKLQLSKEEMTSLNPKDMIGSRVNTYGCEVLMKREGCPFEDQMERPTLEEIMLFITRGNAS